MKGKEALLIVCMLVSATMGLVSYGPGAMTASAAEITVGIGGDYPTIQQAINNATSGDTIYVWAGIYNENVLVNKTLTIIGNGTANTTIDAQGSGSAVTITADGVNITGFTVRGGENSHPHAGIRLDSVNNCRIENINVSSNAFAGILLGSSSNNIISNCTVKENGAGSTGEGIYMSSSHHNIIENSTVSFNSRNGMYMPYSNHNLIFNNNISNNSVSIYLVHGIWINGGTYNTILDNIISGNDVCGIELNSSSSAYSSSFNIIQHNNISSNGYGIRIGTFQPWQPDSWSNENVISNNTITQNLYGAYLNNCEQNQLYHNIFDSNTNQAYDQGSNTWNLTYPQGGNYWSHLVTEDTKKGVSQNITGSDGIADNPFNIPGGGVDQYPLVSPDFVPPTIDYIEIRSAPYGFGTILEDVETDILQTTTGYAAGYNNSMGYLVEVNAEWSVANATGATAYTSPTTGGTSTFHAGATAGNATWTAEYGAATGSANFTIVIPPIHNIDKDTYHNEIQAAIDHADPGNTIVVSPGNYDANILVNKSLTLLGPGAEYPTFNMTFGPNFFMNITADDVTVSGFNLSISGSGFGIPGHGVTLYNVENCVIEDNRFHRLIGRAIEIVEGGNHTILNNTVFQGGLSESMGLYAISSRNNTITNNVFLSSSNGVRLYNFNNNVIHNNTINSSNRDGMLLENSDNNTLHGNTISNNNWHGIRMRYSSNNTLMENTISNNSDGVQLESAGSNNNTFSNNNIKNNNGRGIRLFSDNNDNTIIDNIISNNGAGFWGAGLQVGGSHRITISNNTLSDNWEKGIWVLDSFEIIISGNNISSSMHGIGFQGSPTAISYNTLYHNDIGINNPQHSTIYHNRFIGNTLHATTFSATNTWNRTYALGGGNYWDNWTSPDALKGEEQNIPGADGIVDIPYTVDGSGGIPDHYPWANPYFVAPTMDYLKIRTMAGGEGVIIENQILFPEDEVVGYAASYNHTVGYMGDVIAEWSVDDIGSSTTPGNGTSSTFKASASYGIATWTAEYGVLSTSVVFNITYPISSIIIRTQPDGGGDPIGDQEVDVGFSITGYAAAYNSTHGYLGEVSVLWAVEGADASTNPGTGVSSLFTAGLSYGVANWTASYGSIVATIQFTIRYPTVDYIIIVDHAGTGEEEMGDATLDVGFSITGYAAAFNHTSGYMGDVEANWTATNSSGATASTTPAAGTSSTLHTGRTSGATTWTADHGGMSHSVTFTINEPVVNWIKIRNAPGGAGSVIAHATIPMQNEIKGYAAAYNHTIDYIGDVEVNWSVVNMGSAEATTMPAAGTNSTLSTGNVTGGAVWTAEYGVGINFSATITIVEHGIDYIEIRTAFGGAGEVVTDTSMDIGKSLTGHAAGFNNTHGFIEDVSADWQVLGGTGASTSTATGKTSTFNSGDTTGTATWVAIYMELEYSVVIQITQPSILSTNPADGALGISPLAGTYSIHFSDPMVTSIDTWGNIETNMPVTQWSWNGDGTWINGTYSILSSATTYYINLTTSFTSLAGTPLGGDREKTFTTLQVLPPVVYAGPDRISRDQFLQEGQATDNYEIESYTWEIISGPGSIQFGPYNNNKTTVYAYEDGVYVLRLTVRNIFGISAWDEFNLTWDTQPPMVDAGVNQTIPLGGTAYFDGSGSTDNVGIDNYTWSFFDGTENVILYGPNPNHTFTVIGTFQVTLAVLDMAGNNNFGYMSVDVEDLTPPEISSISANPPVQDAGGNVNITVQVVDDTTVFSVHLNIQGVGNYSMANAQGTSIWYFSNQYHTPGVKYFTIIARDGNDNYRISSVHNFTILEAPPSPLMAHAGPNQTVTAGQLVTFNGSQSTGAIVDYIWTFGDAGPVTLNGVSPTYRFNTPGTYIITLEVRDAESSETDTMEIIVNPDSEDPDPGDGDDNGDEDTDPGTSEGTSPLGGMGKALPILLIIIAAVVAALLYMMNKSKGKTAGMKSGPGDYNPMPGPQTGGSGETQPPSPDTPEPTPGEEILEPEEIQEF